MPTTAGVEVKLSHEPQEEPIKSQNAKQFPSGAVFYIDWDCDALCDDDFGDLGLFSCFVRLAYGEGAIGLRVGEHQPEEDSSEVLISIPESMLHTGIRPKKGAKKGAKNPEKKTKRKAIPNPFEYCLPYPRTLKIIV